MTKFRFAITYDTTMTASVTVEASTIEEAHEIALESDFYLDERKAEFRHDDCNGVRDVYLPDPSQYEVIGEGFDPGAAARANVALLAYAGIDAASPEAAPGAGDPSSPSEASSARYNGACNLMVDLVHLARADGWDFGDLARYAMGTAEEEFPPGEPIAQAEQAVVESTDGVGGT